MTQTVSKKEFKLGYLKSNIVFIVGLHLTLLAAFTYIFYSLLMSYPAVGFDWKTFFEPAARAWMQGESLYAVQGYYNFPWGTWLLCPFVLLGENLGYAVLGAVSLLLFGWILIRQTPRSNLLPLIFLLCIFNHQTLDMFVKGQMVEILFNATGLAIAQWALKKNSTWGMGLSLVFLTAKGPNALLAGVYLCCVLIFSSKNWLRTGFKISLIPSVCVLFSLFLHGFWPIELIETIQIFSPGQTVRTTVFSFLEVRHVPPFLGASLIIIIAVLSWLAFQKANHPDRLIVVLVATYALTPYVQNHGFIVLWAIVAPWLASQGQRGYWMFVAVWIASIGIMAWRLTGPTAFMSLGWLTALLFWVTVLFNVARIKREFPAFREAEDKIYES